MAQWVNHLQNNIFVNPLPLPLLCEISGALHLVQPGLMAGRQAGRRNTDEFRMLKYSLRLTKVQHHYSLTNAFQLVFSGKVDFYSRKFSGSHTISYQSLLLSTTILNDVIGEVVN